VALTKNHLRRRTLALAEAIRRADRLEATYQEKRAAAVKVASAMTSILQDDPTQPPGSGSGPTGREPGGPPSKTPDGAVEVLPVLLLPRQKPAPPQARQREAWAKGRGD